LGVTVFGRFLGVIVGVTTFENKLNGAYVFGSCLLNLNIVTIQLYCNYIVTIFTINAIVAAIETDSFVRTEGSTGYCPDHKYIYFIWSVYLYFIWSEHFI